jgi:hypothetical protein
MISRYLSRIELLQSFSLVKSQFFDRPVDPVDQQPIHQNRSRRPGQQERSHGLGHDGAQ